MSQLLNEYFKSVFTDEDVSNIPELGTRIKDNDQLSTIEITEEIVAKALSSLIKKFDGRPSIPAAFFSN